MIGSRTASNANLRAVGSSCTAERRGIELLDKDAARTQSVRFGDKVRRVAVDAAGHAPFGMIDQQVVKA